MDLSLYSDSDNAPNPPKRRKNSLIPRHLRLNASQKKLSPFEYEKWTQKRKNDHMNKRAASFYPHEGGIMLHEFHRGLPKRANKQQNLKSMCGLGKVFSDKNFWGCVFEKGTEFIKMECQWWSDEDWENLPKESVQRWTTEWRGHRNGYVCDRTIFFLNTTAFCASAWDGSEYKWIEIGSGKPIEVSDAGWENGDVKVLISYE